jgi:hypothetical protein
MKNFKMLIAAAITVTAAAIVPAANAATTVEVLGSGSSAIWQTAGIGAYKLAGTGAGHYTVKGDTGCTQTPACAQMKDSRSASILPIDLAGGREPLGSLELRANRCLGLPFGRFRGREPHVLSGSQGSVGDRRRY